MEEMLGIFAMALRQKAKEASDSDNYWLERKYEELAADLEGVVIALKDLKMEEE
jgi:hypothetical protein